MPLSVQDDHLVIDGITYQGTVCPEGAQITEGSDISWASDGSVAGDGWEICVSAGGKVSQTPPPPAAFTVLSGPCTLEMDGSCVGRPAGYSHSETCEIASTGSAFLQACPVFNTERGCKLPLQYVLLMDSTGGVCVNITMPIHL